MKPRWNNSPTPLMHPPLPARRQYLRWTMGLLGAAVGHPLLAASASALVWRERALLGFGTTLWLKAGDTSADRLEAALDAAVREIRAIERQMSLFDPDSALSRLNARGELLHADARLRDVLSLSSQIARDSGGRFDISMQPLWDVWSRAAAEQRLPSAREVQRARQRVNWQAVTISPAAVRLGLRGMGVSLNGIAQGYAADRVGAVLQSHGIRHAMIDTGETATLGESPMQSPWAFRIEDAASAAGAPPERVQAGGPSIHSDGRAMATSSDAHTPFSADRRHHHILDPRNGYSPVHWSSVTVIADRCVLADALTKVFFMLAPSQVMRAARHWGVDIVMQDKSGRWVASEGARVLLRG